MATKKKAVAKKAGTDMVSMEERLAARVNEASANMTTDSSNVMRMSRDGFRYRGDEQMNFNAIVLGSVMENVYYDRQYDKSNTELVHPLCWAIGKYEPEMAPHKDLKTAVSKSCVGCKFNEFGSKGKGKECQNRRRVALVVVPDIEDFTSINTADVAILRLPPTSLRPYNTWMQQVYRSMGKDPVQVVTNFSINEAMDYGTLDTPEVVGIVPNDIVGELLGIDADAFLNDVTHILDPVPYVSPGGRGRGKQSSQLRSRLS